MHVGAGGTGQRHRVGGAGSVGRRGDTERDTIDHDHRIGGLHRQFDCVAQFDHFDLFDRVDQRDRDEHNGAAGADDDGADDDTLHDRCPRR